MKSILFSQTAELEIKLAGRAVPVRIRVVPGARRMVLRADAVRGEVRISCPRRTPTAAALRFALSRRAWLETQFAKAPRAVRLEAGATLAFCGEEHRIDWREDAPRSVLREPGILRIGGPRDMVEPRLLRWLKSEARRAIAADLEYYCAKAEVERPSLSIGDARTRWGSCSSRGTLRLNWRLIMAPVAVRRSVVAHEVAHIVHMDHGPRFYALLDALFEGDRKNCDSWLKAHGTGLHMVGA